VGQTAGPNGPEPRNAGKADDEGHDGQNGAGSREEVPEVCDPGLQGVDCGFQRPVGKVQVRNVVDLCPELGGQVEYAVVEPLWNVGQRSRSPGRVVKFQTPDHRAMGVQWRLRCRKHVMIYCRSTSRV